MNDLRKLLKKSGVPPGFNSLEEFMARDSNQAMRRTCGKHRNRPLRLSRRAAFFACGSMRQASDSIWPRAPDCGHTRGTSSRTPRTLPHPVVALDAVGRPQDRPYGTGHFSDVIYDLAFDADRGRLLFAGKAGRVSFLEVASGRTGVLVETSERSPIHRTALSREPRCACAVLLPDLPLVHTADGPVLQIWDYQALSGATT